MEEQQDDFFSPENIAELERRIKRLRSGESKLTEHDLINPDDEKD